VTLSTNITSMLSDYQAWRGQSRTFSLLDYVGCVGSPDLFFAFASLFSPDLIEHEGYYFLADRFDLTTYDAWKEKIEDRAEIQKVMNHVHMSMLFQGQEVPASIAVAAANVLASHWSIVFRELKLVSAAAGTDLDSAEVTLFLKQD
jgi:hypothetical protein